jgi:restriction endonuclease S subunit
MAGEWRETTLGQLMSFANGRSSSNRADGLPNPVYGSNGVIGWTAEANADAGSIIIGRVGSYCGSLYFSKQRCWVTDNAICATPLHENDSRFLFYLLNTIGLNNWRTGSGQPLLNQEILRRIPTAVPEPMEQRAIAHILGTLDDKIELNRRMSQTLEAMARALFKSWFVDFDPVRAKMEGRWQRGQSLPGLPAHLYDLFPDRLADSELGEIPEGSRVGRLGDLAQVTSGKRPNKVYPEPQPYASIPLWGGNGPMGYVTEPLYSTPILLTGRVGTLGSVFRIATPCWPSDNTLVVIAREKIAIEFLYFQMKRFDYDALNRGSTQPLLTQTDLNGQQVPLPSNRLLSEFHKHVSTYFAKLDESMNESRTLAALRDALLPKLIRGEIRVKDADRFLKERGQ